MDQPGYNEFSPAGWAVAQGFDAIGASDGALRVVRHVIWWSHGLLALAFVAAIPYTKASHMLASFGSLVVRDPLAGKRLRAIPPELAAEPAGYGALADFSGVHLLHLDACTKCGKCHEACPALATGRPLSPRDVVLELREQANDAMREVGIGGVLGVLIKGQQPDERRLRAPRGARGRRARGHGLVLHAMQRVRRGVPGGDRAGADHQPAAPPPRRGGRAARQPPGDPPDDPQVRQLVRRAQPQARPLDRGARLRDQGRAQGAGGRPLVRRRLRLLRSAQPEGEPDARAPLPRCGARLRDPLRRRAQLRQRRSPRGRGGTVRGARRAEHRDARGVRLQPDRDERSALAQHAAQRVPGADLRGARRVLERRPPHRAPARADRVRPAAAPRPRSTTA